MDRGAMSTFLEMSLRERLTWALCPSWSLRRSSISLVLLAMSLVRRATWVASWPMVASMRTSTCLLEGSLVAAALQKASASSGSSMLLTSGASHPSSTMWVDVAEVGVWAVALVGAVGAGNRVAEIADAMAGAWAGAIFLPLSAFFETRLAVRLGGAVEGAEDTLSSRTRLRTRLGLGVASSTSSSDVVVSIWRLGVVPCAKRA